METKPSIGGQAVLEGVMMKAPDAMAIAVRQSNGRIDVHKEPVTSPKKGTFVTWPIVRGVNNFIQMMVLGTRIIGISSDMLGEDEGAQDEKPSRFETWFNAKTGKRLEDLAMPIAMVIGVVMAAGLFIALPSLASTLLQRVIASPFVLYLLEGVVRIAIFVGYLTAVSSMKEIKRTFMYHGAEHKTVHCYEHDAELTPENARTFSRLHPRCGTSFLLIVMVISILFFSLLGAAGFRGSYLMRVGVRLLMMPLVAGVSYEVLKWAARSENVVVRALRWPGIQLQRLTTREPSDDMLEVAIAAFKVATGQPWAQAGVKEDAQGDGVAEDARGEADEGAEDAQGESDGDVACASASVDAGRIDVVTAADVAATSDAAPTTQGEAESDARAVDSSRPATDLHGAAPEEEGVIA